MRKLCPTLVLGASLLFSVFVNGQTTIGSGEKAVPGALLQLKENDEEGSNSNKGLLLPRVQLVDHSLKGIEIDVGDSPEMYTGLVVWNVRGVGDICKGVQMWNGSKWEYLMPYPQDHTSYNPQAGILTDHQGNTYRTARFGDAGIWMIENLRSTRAPKSCEDVYFAGEFTEEDYTRKMNIRVIMYPNGKADNPTLEHPDTWTEEQGLLYSWALASNGKGGEDGKGNTDNPLGNVDEFANQPVARQGICPDGWHLPSAAEWKKLFSVLENDATSTATDIFAQYSGRTYPVGERGGLTSAKANEPLPSVSVIPNGASKTLVNGGFSALLTGESSMKTGNFGNFARFWTATANSVVISDGGAFAYGVSLLPASTTYNPQQTSQIFAAYRRSHLFSVRCIKDGSAQ